MTAGETVSATPFQFSLQVDSGAWTPITVTVPAGASSINASNVIGSLNAALAAAGVNDVYALDWNNQVRLLPGTIQSIQTSPQQPITSVGPLSGSTLTITSAATGIDLQPGQMVSIAGVSGIDPAAVWTVKQSTASSATPGTPFTFQISGVSGTISIPSGSSASWEDVKLPLGTPQSLQLSVDLPVTAVLGGTYNTPITITAPSSNLVSGQSVYLSGVNGINPGTAWTVTAVDGSHFSLNGSGSNGPVSLPATGTATWRLASGNPVTAVLGFTDGQTNAWPGGTTQPVEIVNTGTITAVAGGSGQAITITSANHGLVNGQAVYIQGITGVPSNVLQTVTKIDNNTFQLTLTGSASITPGTTPTWVLPLADTSIGGFSSGSINSTSGLNLLSGDPSADIVVASPSSNQVSIFPGSVNNQPAVTLASFTFNTSQSRNNADPQGFTTQAIPNSPANLNPTNTPYTNLWHLETSRRQTGGTNHSGPSFYFGDSAGNYDVGYAGGELDSPAINLTGASTLWAERAVVVRLPAANRRQRGHGLRRGQRFRRATRQRRLADHVTVDAHSFQQVHDREPEPRGPRAEVASSSSGWATTNWNTATYSLSSAATGDFRGQVIRLAFTFATGDNLYNDYEGWYVDDVTVTRLATNLTAASAAAAGATARATDINAASGFNPTDLTALSGTLYFSATDGATGNQLWAYNPTAGTTTRITDINPASGFDPAGLTVLSSTLYFSATDGATGNQLWAYNPTAGTTTRITDINPASGFDPAGLTALNGTLYFSATDGATGNQLWAYNPTAGTTTRITDINPASGFDPAGLTALSSTLYFSATDGATGNQLWAYNPTAGTTTRVTDINAAGGFNPADLTALSGTLYFSATDGATGNQLWAYNPAAGTTTRVTDINPGSGFNPAGLTVLNGNLYFSATDGMTGTELWVYSPTLTTLLTQGLGSNGLGAATLVAVINPGSGSSNPAYLTALNGKLYFEGNNGVTGDELWVYDPVVGTANQVQKIQPGSTGSAPAWLTAFNGDLYFQASDGVTGVQLWTYNPSPAVTLQGAAGSGYATSVAAVGATVDGVVQDFLGDHVPDLAVFSKNGVSDSISIYSTPLNPSSTPVVSVPFNSTSNDSLGAADDYTLLAAGDINGDGRGDLLLTSLTGPSYIVLTNSANPTTPTVVPVSQSAAPGGLVPLGDITGNGMADLGNGLYTVTTDQVAENGTVWYHAAGQVFLGSSITTDAAAGKPVASPDMIVETADPYYTTSTPLSALPIGSLGAVGGDDSPLGGTITAVSGGSGNPVVITSPDHGLSSGQRVRRQRRHGRGPNRVLDGHGHRCQHV